MSDEQAAIQFAKRYAESGYYVFPLYSSSKGAQKPYGWARNDVDASIDPSKIIPATNDPKEIEKWPEKILHGYNASLVSYGVMGINCIIFDLDNKNDKDGTGKFRELMKKHNIPPPNFVIKSKSGGFHLYYKKPEKLQNVRVKTMANISIGGVKYDGIDVRGDGGMVIGPSTEGDENIWVLGKYQIIKGNPTTELSEMPYDVVAALMSAHFNDAVDNLSSLTPDDINEESNILECLKRGEIPKFLPNGFRNQGFYLFINALKNKGFTLETSRKYVEQLKLVTENIETLKDSINVDDMLARIYQVSLDNPFDVSRHLIDLGLYRVTGGGKIKYVIIEDNPYFSSQNLHDLQALKQLMKKYERTMQNSNGKEKIINPADLLDKYMDSTSEIDYISYKPGASKVFSSNENSGRRFLNSWQDVRLEVDKTNIDNTVWDEFLFIISSIFGKPGSDEYQLGLDLPAWLIQKPGIKPGIVPFIQSFNRGVGKSCYMNTLRHVMCSNKVGDNQARMIRLEEISGRFFNPNGASLLMIDEVQFATHRNMRQESTSFWKNLKTLVTSPVMPIEIKGGGTFEMPSLSGLILAGNSNNHFPIEEADRRIWIIDNNPQILSKGLCNSLFDLEKADVSRSRKITIANTIRYYLSQHKIQYKLDEMRAPMNDIKRDMYMNSLTDIEEWFITHFENIDNICAASAAVTKEMVLYALETSERMLNSTWRDNPESTFRELKKRGMLVSIKSKNQNNQTRQLSSVPNINDVGQALISKERCAIYTSRNHGCFNSEENSVILEGLSKNVATVQNWRTNKIGESTKALIS